jgi:hypothetical protein
VWGDGPVDKQCPGKVAGELFSIVGFSMVVNIRTGSAVYIESVSRRAAAPDHDRNAGVPTLKIG